MTTIDTSSAVFKDTEWLPSGSWGGPAGYWVLQLLILIQNLVAPDQWL